MTRENVRVLVVDDNVELAENIAEILELEDIRGEVASNGRSALAMMQETDYDLVVTDIRMPGMNGVELLRTIHERWPAKPVIVMSAYSNDATLGAAARAGALDVLAKPVDCAEIVALIERVVTPRAPLLVLEDNDALRVNLTELLLSSTAAIPYPAADLATAERLLASVEFQAALIDVHLPDGDGLDLGQRLMQRSGNAMTVVYMTGVVDDRLEELQAVVQNASAMRLLRKPFSSSQLLELLSDLAED